MHLLVSLHIPIVYRLTGSVQDFVHTEEFPPVKQGARPTWWVKLAATIWSQLNHLSFTHRALVKIITIHWKPHVAFLSPHPLLYPENIHLIPVVRYYTALLLNIYHHWFFEKETEQK